MKFWGHISQLGAPDRCPACRKTLQRSRAACVLRVSFHAEHFGRPAGFSPLPPGKQAHKNIRLQHQRYSNLCEGPLLVPGELKQDNRNCINMPGISNAEPALPWAVQGQAEPAENVEEPKEPVELKEGRRVRVRKLALQPGFPAWRPLLNINVTSSLMCRSCGTFMETTEI